MKVDLSNAIIFWRRYRKNTPAAAGVCIVLTAGVLALVAPYVASHDPFAMSPDKAFESPSLNALFGTDQFGRDVFSRVVWGTRVTLFIGFVASSISALVGTLLGSSAGYFGGKIDDLVMRIADLFLTIPIFFLILVIVAAFGPSIWNVMVVIGLTVWPGTARLVRGQFLSVKEREFVQAAIAVGARPTHIIFKEILPNAVHPAIVDSSLLVARSVLIEAALSFLGLGDPNQVSWGWMLHDAFRFYQTAWWMAIFPGLAISITVVAFNLIGDGLSDALNPRLKERR